MVLQGEPLLLLVPWPRKLGWGSVQRAVDPWLFLSPKEIPCELELCARDAPAKQAFRTHAVGKEALQKKKPTPGIFFAFAQKGLHRRARALSARRRPNQNGGPKTIRLQGVCFAYRVILGLYRDNGKENGNYYNRLFWNHKVYIGDILGLYRENGKENGNYHITGLYRVILGLYRGSMFALLSEARLQVSSENEGRREEFMVASQNRSQNGIILIIGPPKRVPLILGNPKPLNPE